MTTYGYGMKDYHSGYSCSDGQHVSRRVAGRGHMPNAKAHDKPIKTSHRMRIKRQIRNNPENI